MSGSIRQRHHLYKGSLTVFLSSDSQIVNYIKTKQIHAVQIRIINTKQ